MKILDFLKKYEFQKYNTSLVVTVVAISIISAFALRLEGGTEYGGSQLRGQVASLFVGLIIIGLVSLVDYHLICKFVIIYYIIGTAMVAATRFTPLGLDHDTGSFRWLRIGFEFQPSEICKLVIILTLAVYFNRMRKKVDKFYTLLIAGVILFFPLIFILVQSDLSSSVVILCIFSLMVFASGIGYKILLPVLAVLIPIVILFFWYNLQPGDGPFKLKDYQVARLVGFRNPEKYDKDIMYQQLNSIKSIASGETYGKYLEGGASDIRNYKNVQVTESDFIWSVIGEEFGFIGSCVVLLLMAIIIFKCLLTAKRAGDYLGMMIAIGIAAMFMFQIFANIGVTTMILPNTGLPLPFISAGRSSMLCSMTAIGMIINIGISPVKSISNGLTFK